MSIFKKILGPGIEARTSVLVGKNAISTALPYRVDKTGRKRVFKLKTEMKKKVFQKTNTRRRFSINFWSDRFRVIKFFFSFCFVLNQHHLNFRFVYFCQKIYDFFFVGDEKKFRRWVFEGKSNFFLKILKPLHDINEQLKWVKTSVECYFKLGYQKVVDTSIIN